GNICSDGKCGPVELIDEKAITPSELFGELADSVSEVDGLLVDDQFLEGKIHEEEGGKSRVDRRFERVVRSTHYSLKSPLLPLCGKRRGGDSNPRTPVKESQH